MYQIFFDAYPLYDPRDEELVLHKPDVHLAVGEAGEMSFTIYPDHPFYDRITERKGTVTLKSNAGAIFRGRVIKDTLDFEKARKIEIEGLLACLNDSVIPPFAFPDDFSNDPEYLEAATNGNVVAFFLGWILAQHNAQVQKGQRVMLGDVTVSDPNNYISRASSDYTSALDIIRTKLEDLLGGYLLADYTEETPVLHYYQDLPLTNTQAVEFGENLLDFEVEADAADTYTAVLPVGKDGLTIAALPDGEISPGYFKEGLIVYSQEAENRYTERVTRVVEWKDVTVADNLRDHAADLLAGTGVKLAQTIKVKAADLGTDDNAANTAAIVGEAIAGLAVVGQTQGQTGGVSRFVVGRQVILTSRPHGIATTYPLMELDPDILNPGNTRITLGATTLTASGLAQANQSATQEKLGQQQLELNRQQAGLTDVNQSMQEQITSAVQTSEQILFDALARYVETSNFEEYQQTVQSQLALLSDTLTLQFTQTTQRLNNINGDLQSTVDTLTKYFEFNQDGLTIKAGDNSLNLNIDNDLITFTKNGQQFGWWDGVDFHTGNIVIDVTERAQFGNFAFVPRTNGSLSFLKVGG